MQQEKVTQEFSFGGFVPPVSNYFRMPNEWINICAEINSLAEIKVVQYVLRHTWGFHEYDGKSKPITIDEFMYGRISKGERMDKGTGLSKQSVVDGVKNAIKHGYLICEIDDKDKARIIKSYALNMAISNSDVKDLDTGIRCLESRHQMSKILTPDVKDLDSKSQESRQRSEKETKERHLKKNTKERQNDAGQQKANVSIQEEDDSFTHSSSLSLSSSSEKPEVVFTPEEDAFYVLCCGHLFQAKRPEKTEKVKEQCGELAPHIKSHEQLTSLIELARKEQKIEDKKPLYLGNLTKALNGWLQVQPKPKKTYATGEKPYSEMTALEQANYNHAKYSAMPPSAIKPSEMFKQKQREALRKGREEYEAALVRGENPY